ncbi:MAG: metallophosphoesterase family protein [Oscillospiraceae bacterium]|nr:metallophosphoesterase family protein [Oscillospiraceae bacterium]
MKKLRAFVLCLLVLALLAGGLWFGNNVLQTEEFTFRSSDLPAGFDGWRVMVLADLHGKSFGSQQEKLLAAVKNEAPEAIFLIGDLVDERTEDAEGYCAQLGAALSALAPTYYVTGNHEWARHDAPAIKKTLQEAGVTVLSNEFLPLTRGDDTVILAGIDDPNGYADQKTPEQLASELYAACGDPFWLLLAHRNDHFAAQYSLLGADLTISGHGHGGCIRLPFTDGLLGTQRNLFPSHTAGFYEDNGCTLFVTRGLGNVGITFRVFNRPQIAVITVEKEG